MGRFIAAAVESALAQDYPDLTIVVRDGGSTDNSEDLVRSFGPPVWWVSAPDHGPADALRRAFAVAEGELLGWLNADDLLLPGALRVLAAALNENPAAVAAYGLAEWIDEQGRTTGAYPVKTVEDGDLARECFVCQPACLFRAAAYRTAGGIDPRWDCAFDYDLWIRLARLGSFVHVRQQCALQRMHPGAKTLRQRRVVFEEGMALLAHHYGYVPFAWIHSYVCYRIDGRDQVFEPMRDARWKHLLSVPYGLWRNRRHPRRFLGDWLAHTRFGAA